MNWENRLQPATYTAPSGKSFTFDFKKVEVSATHRASIFRTPNKPGAYAIDFGMGERKYPLTAYVFGNDYDIEADKLVLLLEERGHGKLDHPVYGTKTVQVMGYKRKDDPADRAGVGIINIDFIESTETTFVETKKDVEDDLKKKRKKLNKENPEELDKEIKKLGEVLKKSETSKRMKEYLDLADKHLRPELSFFEEAEALFNAIHDSLNDKITKNIGKPLVLASQMNALIKVPATLVQRTALRLQGYTKFATDLRERSSISALTKDTKSKLLEVGVLLSAIETAISETLMNSDFKTRGEALVYANVLLELHEVNKAFMETEEAKFQAGSLELLIYGNSEQTRQLEYIVQVTAAKLADVAFGLAQERSIILSRDRTIIDLAFELFGSIDDVYLDALIDINNLEGDEIDLMPEGKEITYYG